MDCAIGSERRTAQKQHRLRGEGALAELVDAVAVAALAAVALRCAQLSFASRSHSRKCEYGNLASAASCKHWSDAWLFSSFACFLPTGRASVWCTDPRLLTARLSHRLRPQACQDYNFSAQVWNLKEKNGWSVYRCPFLAWPFSQLLK